MKTAKQWSDEWQRKDFYRSLEQQFEAAQLDAFKAGAEWAAGKLSNLPANYAQYANATIMSAASNLKELPK